MNHGTIPDDRKMIKEASARETPPPPHFFRKDVIPWELFGGVVQGCDSTRVVRALESRNWRSWIFR
jgi:hypothetical protein